MQDGLDGRPGVPDGCWWVVRIAAEGFDEFLGVVTRSSSGLKDGCGQLDAGVPFQIYSFPLVWQ